MRHAIYDVLNSNANILVGDADGIDAEIQKLCKSQNYNFITVYTINSKPRNNFGNFNVKNIATNNSIHYKDAFVQKDIAMTNESDYGIVIWDGESKGSYENIVRLIRQNKLCMVYVMKNKKWHIIENASDIKKITNTSMQLSFI